MSDDDGRHFWMAWNLVPFLGKAARRMSRRIFPLLAKRPESGEKGKIKAGTFSLLVQALKQYELEAALEREWKKVKEMGCRVLTPADADYPDQLREIHDPPPVLYMFGSFSPRDEVALAIVGARQASHYGRQAARWISSDLAAAGVTIVSGLARGIDTEAHRAAIDAGGRTLAVLGSGLDRPYPRENRSLCEKIAGDGAVLSPFPLGAEPLAMNFPARNRIISGLSFGTLVVEATERSGSLITANFALEQGREVFAVPGRITHRGSVGTNFLIKNGAGLVQSAADILQEFPPYLSAKLPSRPVSPDPEKNGGDLTSEELSILSFLSVDEAIHIDSLADKVSLRIPRLLDRLLQLEIRDRVVHLPGQNYILRIKRSGGVGKVTRHR